MLLIFNATIHVDNNGHNILGRCKILEKFVTSKVVIDVYYGQYCS